MMRLLRLLPALSLLLVTTLLAAQGTHLWTQSTAAEFEHGTPEAVSISSLGRLEAGPAAQSLLTTGSTFVWSVAADKAANAYLATGSPASVIRVNPSGTQTRLFTTKDLAVQVVRVGPDGSVYAATLPTGRVYRLDPAQVDQDEARASLIFDPAQTVEKPKYVWDLAFDSAGRLYVATGAPGGIYRIAQSAQGTAAKPAAATVKPELFYASDEPHIRALCFDKAGILYAGSDGSGLVYRIGPDGKGFVLFEAAKREVTALAMGAAGQLYVAAVGERGRSSLPPLPVQGMSSVTTTITVAQPGSVQAFTGNTVIPDGSEIDLIPAGGGAPRRLWSSREDIVYALEATPEGLLAATGNRGHIYRIAENGTGSDIAHLLASQVTGLARSGAGLYAATANTGKLYLLGETGREGAGSSYQSEVFDAQGHSEWGRFEVLASGGYRLFARTGNVENPLRGWTDWVRIESSAKAPALVAARFLQWKVELDRGAGVTSVGVNYLPANVPPSVDEMIVAPGTRVNMPGNQGQMPQQTSISFQSQQGQPNYDGGANGPLAAVRDKTAVTARWAAHDENGDELSYSLFFRSEADGSHPWQLLKDKVSERFYTFDASLLPDGAYRIKVVASDAPSHAPGEALEAERESPVFLIATATPQVTGLTVASTQSALHVTATATDVATPIARAEYSVDAGPWVYVEPAGKLSDSLTERYDFTVALGAKNPASEHSVTLRVFDRYDNAGTAKATAR